MPLDKAPTLPLPPAAIPMVRRWMWLGVFALACAGLYAILLVGARSPGVQQVIPFYDAFHTVLIVHVNLSVLVWFLVPACLLWTIYGPPRPVLSKAGLGCAFAGTLLLILSPFLYTRGLPLTNNYVPVLVNPVFFAFIGVFFAGILLMAVKMLSSTRWQLPRTHDEAQRFGVASAALIVLMSLAGFAASRAHLDPTALEPEAFYEYVFWAGGHILQFAHTTLVIVVWLWLAAAVGARVRLSPRFIAALYGLNVAIAASSLYAYLAYDVLTDQFVNFFTLQMRQSGGLAAIAAGVMVMIALIKQGRPAPGTAAVWSCLVTSLLLFAGGGFLGWLIHGANVVIPAHYHGAIVGITLAFMGLFYLLLPRVGGRAPGKMAVWQPWLYAFGQFLHIAGLAWSGGYGVLRKTPGLMETSKAKAAMGLMGAGGAVAIVGGILFVVVMWRGLRGRTIGNLLEDEMSS